MQTGLFLHLLIGDRLEVKIHDLSLSPRRPRRLRRLPAAAARSSARTSANRAAVWAAVWRCRRSPARIPSLLVPVHVCLAPERQVLLVLPHVHRPQHRSGGRLPLETVQVGVLHTESGACSLLLLFLIEAPTKAGKRRRAERRKALARFLFHAARLSGKWRF